MKNDFYFTLLKVMANNGLNRPTNISTLTQEYFSDQNNASDPFHTSVKKNIDIYFDEMVKSNHIKNFINRTDENARFSKSSEYVAKIEVHAEITISGYLFYQQYKNSKITRIMARLALFVAAASAIFTGGQLINKHNEAPLKMKEPLLMPNTKFPQIKKAIITLPKQKSG